MNVHWHRVVAFALVLAMVILAIVFWPELGGVLSTVRSVGDRYADAQDRIRRHRLEIVDNYRDRLIDVSWAYGWVGN